MGRCMGRPGHAIDGTRGPVLASALGVFTAQFILFGLVAAQLADAVSFTVGVARFGIGVEANGLASAMYGLAGFAGVLAMKGGAILATIAIRVAGARDYPRLLVWGGAAATSMGLLGFVANTWTMAILA